MVVRDGFAYITKVQDHNIQLIRVSTTPVKEDAVTENTVIASFESPELIQTGEYNIDENRLEIRNRFDEIYFYDLANEELSIHPEITSIRFGDQIRSETITFSDLTRITDILYYLGAVILVITVLYHFNGAYNFIYNEL